MGWEIFDCLKCARDICIKTIISSQNTAFRCTPALVASCPTHGYFCSLPSFAPITKPRLLGVLHPSALTLLIPLPLPTDILFSSKFRLHHETKMAAPWTSTIFPPSRSERGAGKWETLGTRLSDDLIYPHGTVITQRHEWGNCLDRLLLATTLLCKDNCSAINCITIV